MAVPATPIVILRYASTGDTPRIRRRSARFAGAGGQSDGVEPRLLEELARLVHFGGRYHMTPARRHARRVFLGSKRRGRDYAARYRKRVGRLGRGSGRGASAQQQADKQLTMDGSESQ